MSSGDRSWTPALRSSFAPERHDVIYMPVPVFLETFSSIEEVLLGGLMLPSWHFNSEWGEGTSGGNPTLVTWRENPLYVVRNTSEEPLQIIAAIGQPDQRHKLHLMPNRELNYIQCGLVLSQSTDTTMIPTYLVTGNNHRMVHTRLFVDSRELVNLVTVPPQSLCYLVPSAMFHEQGKFLLSYWYQKRADLKQMKIERLSVKVERRLPAIRHLELKNKGKDRVDFLVDVPTDIHILVRQEKPFKSSTGGDAMTEDFIGSYLYDGDDRRIQGVTLATNYREIGLVHNLPEPGRYAICVTCPHSKGIVPCKVEVVGVEPAHVRITDRPERAGELGEVNLDFLDAQLESVPLEDLHLHDDKTMQGLLAILNELHKDPKGNEEQIRALEQKIKDHASAMAKMIVGKDRSKYLQGHDLDWLNPFLDCDEDYMSTERLLYELKKDPRNAAKVQRLEELLRQKADAIAERAKKPDFSFLDPVQEGIPIQEIDLMGDDAFAAMMREHMKLSRDPLANAKKIAALEAEMNKRAREMAAEIHAKERTFLDPEPEGRYLSELPLNTDALFMKCEAERRKAKKEGANSRHILALEEQMNARSHQLAKDMNAGERPKYMKAEYFRVPLTELPLDNDGEFGRLEAERAHLCHDPKKNVSQIAEVEATLNRRAGEMAAEFVRQNRMFLGDELEGVKVCHLPLDDDTEFTRLEAKRAALKKSDPQKNAQAIKDIENQLLERASYLAKRLKHELRKVLDARPLGVPLESLPLDDDERFRSLENDFRELGSDPRNREKVEKIIDKLNARAREMAQELHEKERGVLNQYIEGVPLSSLPLDADEEFNALEMEARALRKAAGSRGNASAQLKELEDAMNQRAAELVHESRKAFCGAAPEGIPLELLRLGDDKEFIKMEEKLRALRKDPSANKEAISNLEHDLKKRAHEIAKKLLEGDRSYLDTKPCGVPLAVLNIDNDPIFHALEAERAKLKASHRPQDSRKVKELEDKLNERLIELAKEQLAEDLRGVEQTPRGIPVNLLRPHDDQKFGAMVKELRVLKADAAANSDEIRALQAKMSKRVDELAGDVLQGCRDKLHPYPEKLPLKDLPLNEDKVFSQTELELAKLKLADAAGNAARIADLENQLNDRALHIARAVKQKDLEALDAAPRGIPLALLRPHDDELFASLAKEARGTGSKSKGLSSQATDAMNARVRELADQALKGDRGYLDPEPNGIPLGMLPLDTDQKFHEIEVERAVLKLTDAKKNASKITALEARLNDRAHELADQVLKGDRGYLDPNPEGVPLACLPLDLDKKFHKMEVERCKLKANAERNAVAIARLEAALNDRAHEIAKELKETERAILNTTYYGIPRELLPLDKDRYFRDMEHQLREIRQSPHHNATDIRNIQEMMQARADELGLQMLKGDRSDYLEPEYEGVELVDVPIDDDKVFTELELERAILKAKGHDSKKIKDLEEKLRNRFHELARERVQKDRMTLDPEPEGIPIRDIPLDEDANFRRMEAQLRKLSRDKERNRSAISEMRESLNYRAHELAKEVIADDLKCLKKEYRMLPKEALNLHKDEKFRDLANQRRIARKRGCSSAKMAIIEEAMDARASQIADDLIRSERAFLDPEPEGMDLADVPLDTDKIFLAMEAERRGLAKDPRSQNQNRDVICELEAGMNARSHVLALEEFGKMRVFLEQEPEGIALKELPLDIDPEFRRAEVARYRKLKDPNRSPKALEKLEAAMNDRVRELARECLRKLRAFLDPEPEGVPLAELPFSRDPVFLNMERDLAKLRKAPNASPETVRSLEEHLKERVNEIAREFLRKERTFLDPEPFGVPLDDLPLNHDPALNALERKRRKQRKDPKHSISSIRAYEDDIQARVKEIAREFVEKEREFLDAEPEGIMLRYVPINSDKKFRRLEIERREKLRHSSSKSDNAAVKELEDKMNERAHALAKEMLWKNISFLDPEPLGVPLKDVPFENDEKFKHINAVLCMEVRGNKAKVGELQEALNARLYELAAKLLEEERAFLPPAPFGIPLEELPLNEDLQLRAIERARRKKRAQSLDDSEEKAGMTERVMKIAHSVLESDRGYLHPNRWEVPLKSLALDTDSVFHPLELERIKLKREDAVDGAEIREIERSLNARALQLAEEYIIKERAFLEEETNGVPLNMLALDEDATFHTLEVQRQRLRNSTEGKEERIAEVEGRMRRRVRELAFQYRGWQDEEFHEANKHMAEEWPRICQLYPEGVRDSVVPEKLSSGDVISAPGNKSYLAPFITALGRQFLPIDRLFETKWHPPNGPYTCVFYDSNSILVRVDIDDRVPVDANMEPKFTRVPRQSWYPLLLEKAYAKFVGGYSRLDQCAPHETLRDLTGRPVTHTLFVDELAEAAGTGDFRSVNFWDSVAKDLERGDVIVCMSSVDPVDGIHPQCCYAVLGVIETAGESSGPADVVVKLHNCYFDAPTYNGPLNREDPRWDEGLKQICSFDPSREEHLYLPLPVFLRNFSSMQQCHINCGDRLSASGEWNKKTCGGSPMFTTFRSNPIYLVENKSTRPVRILAELHHEAPSSTDRDGVNHYHQTGLAVLQPVHVRMPPSPLITHNTHRFIQKGMMLDTREVCSQPELPPNMSCYLVPYTLKRGCQGRFTLSVYHGLANVTLTPLRNAGLSREPLVTKVALYPGNKEGTRVDFLLKDTSDVHILLRQAKATRSTLLDCSDLVAEDLVSFHVCNEYGIREASTAALSDAREQALIFRAVQSGRYSIIMVCAGRRRQEACPCRLFVFVAKEVGVEFVSVPRDAKPLGSQPRLPALPRSAPYTSRPEGYVRAYSQDRVVYRSDSLSHV
ncbi:putative calpain-like cysteine peptidase [Trypanosoma rangeli]|uniref:Putative calpain-like cysteine peptidase n=1 Tax=Trypanosoma rangeli TaxID=5698 RepID=A0A422MXF8_TRYRA|nr:putative calpain-like cysteine peptidase [Trypanosoma rangeli]RNE97859.1 putative calpain-like cysteine peptidase [Trypanosoma rangeli]|eukprot:RNE97859.1 putative calpain-like cysteine peptidase [Trypanosoma rangeli]